MGWANLSKIQLWDYQNNGKYPFMREVETPSSDLVKRNIMHGNADRTRTLLFQTKFQPQGDGGDANLGVGDLIVLHAQIK